MTMRSRRLVPMLALAIVLSVVPWFGASAQDATPFAGAGEPDIAAMVLTPGDLDALGLPGYGRFYNGNFAGIDAIVEGNAAGTGVSVEETRALYEGFGWRRIYTTALGQASVAGDPDSPPAGGVVSSIQELDAAQADAYFTYFGTERDTGETRTTAEAPFSLGDGAVIVNLTFHNDEAGSRYSEFRLIFHRGDTFGHVVLWVDQPDAAGTPEAVPSGLNSPAGTVEQLQMLGQRQLERMEEVLAGQSPNLPQQVLRLGDAFFDATNYSEGYRLLDGETIPYYGDRTDDLLADPAATTGATAVYELEESFQRGEEGVPGDPYLLNRLYQFADEAAATAFMDGRADALATGGFRGATGATDESRSELMSGEATDIGDQSLAFDFVRAFDDGWRVDGYEIFVRVGAMVAAVSLEGPADMPLDEVTAIAEAQTACLKAGACPDAYPIPEWFLAAPDATPVAATPTE